MDGKRVSNTIQPAENRDLIINTFDDFQYCSGWGSHDSEVLNPYVDNVKILLKSLWVLAPKEAHAISL